MHMNSFEKSVKSIPNNSNNAVPHSIFPENYHLQIDLVIKINYYG